MAFSKTPAELLRTERLGNLIAAAKQVEKAEDIWFMKLQVASQGMFEPSFKEDEPEPQNEAERQWAETDRRAKGRR